MTDLTTKVLAEVERCARVWGNNELMKESLDGARLFAINLLIGEFRGTDEATGLVNEAIRKGLGEA